MEKKIRLLLVSLVLAVTIKCYLVCESAHVEAKATKHEAEENMQDAHEKAESWVNWAQFKLSLLGLNKENAREAIENIMNKAGGAASKATETIKSAASGLSRYASQNEGTMNGGRDSVSFSKVYEETKRRLKMVLNLASDKAGDAYDFAKQKLNWESDVALNKAGDVKNTVTRGNGHTTNQAANAYDDAVHNLKEKYNSAKETMSDQAKAKYEAAKEKASDAAGLLGSEMRDKTGEL